MLIILPTLILCAAVLMWARAAHASTSVEAKIRAAFGAHATTALRVARCESRLRPAAVSPTNDVGVFQINYRAHHHPGESFSAFRRRLSDADTNIAFAVWLSRGGRDWSAWTMSRRCWA